MNAPGPDPAATAVRPGFWRRRVVDPLIALLTQGVTPDWLAATLAACSVCSLFPSLGATSALNLGLGLWLRMNQPVLQCLNQLPGPVLVAMILAVRVAVWSLRLGSHLLRRLAGHHPAEDLRYGAMRRQWEGLAARHRSSRRMREATRCGGRAGIICITGANPRIQAAADSRCHGGYGAGAARAADQPPPSTPPDAYARHRCRVVDRPTDDARCRRAERRRELA